MIILIYRFCFQCKFVFLIWNDDIYHGIDVALKNQIPMNESDSIT